MQHRFRKALALITLISIIITFCFYYVPNVSLLPRLIMTIEPSNNWVVLDDVYDQCVDVTGFMKQTGWSVVVVSERTYIKGCSLPRCFQLTNSYVRTGMNHFSVVKLLTRANHLSGYLFALQYGAKVILDADCDSPVEEINRVFNVEQFHQSGLSYNDTPFFNPFHHFGIMEAFPKDELFVEGGKNSTGLTEHMNSDNYYITDWNSVSVRQGVMVSKKSCFKTSNMVIDTQAIIQHTAPVSVKYPTISSFSTGPTLFFEDVFMLMFIPPDIEVEIQKLFRTLFFNILNSSARINSAFYFIPNKPGRDSDCFQSKHALYSTGTIVAILNCVHSCGELQSGCFAIIYTHLWTCLVKEFPHLKDSLNMTNLVDAWYEDISRLGINVKKTISSESKYMFKMVYRIPKQIDQFRDIKPAVKEAICKYAITLCGQVETKALNAMQKMSNPIIDDILLIIVINYVKLFPSVSYNEYVHRQYFKYIVYCVPSLVRFDNYTARLGLSHLTFIEGLTEGWYFFYECTSAAMKLSLPVKGYLQVGDDVLLNSWNIVAMPRYEMMMFSRESYVDLYQNDPNHEWVHWNTRFGQVAVKKAIFQLKKASVLNSNEQLSKYHRVNFTHFAITFLDNLKDNIGPNLVAFGGTDIFYVPERLKNEYITATEIFRSSQCMVELALRVIHLGLMPPGKRKYVIEGSALWGWDRTQPWTFFNATHHAFIHPFKWLLDARGVEGRQFVCRTYMPLLLKGNNFIWNIEPNLDVFEGVSA